jgi:hypothetical protein
MPTRDENKAFSESYQATISQIVNKELLGGAALGLIRGASEEENRYQALDLVLLDQDQEIDAGAFGSKPAHELGLAGVAGRLAIGYRNRRQEYLGHVQRGFTLRAGIGPLLEQLGQWVLGWEMKTVLYDGCLDVYFYGVVDENEYGKYLWYQILDMNKVRDHVDRLRKNGVALKQMGRLMQSSDNQFYGFNLMAFPRDVVIIERCSETLYNVDAPIDLFGNRRIDVIEKPQGFPRDIIAIDDCDSLVVQARKYFRVIRENTVPTTLSNLEYKIINGKASPKAAAPFEPPVDIFGMTRTDMLRN